MSDEHEVITPAEMLARVRAGRTAFESEWAGLTEAQMTQRPGPQADWSVKDLIVHICWWETSAVERIEGMLAGEGYTPLSDFDTMNAEIFEANKDRPLAEVLAAFAANMGVLEQFIEGMDTETLTTVPEDAEGAAPPAAYLVGNTYGHYEEHLPDLQAYVVSLREG